VVERVEDAAGVATRHAEDELDAGFFEDVDQRVGDVDLGRCHGMTSRGRMVDMVISDDSVAAYAATRVAPSASTLDLRFLSGAGRCQYGPWLRAIRAGEDPSTTQK